MGEPFFERHGPKAVFFGRFVLGLRVWASWLAGATRMHWRSFAAWNALGGIAWATAIGLIAYFLGSSASSAIEAFGLYGLAAVLLAILSGFLMHRHARRHRREHAHSETGEPPPFASGGRLAVGLGPLGGLRPRLRRASDDLRGGARLDLHPRRLALARAWGSCTSSTPFWKDASDRRRGRSPRGGSASG